MGLVQIGGLSGLSLTLGGRRSASRRKSVTDRRAEDGVIV